MTTSTRSITAAHVTRGKRVARTLHQTLSAITLMRIPLSECQEAAASMMGFDDWQHLVKSPGPVLKPQDEALQPHALAERLAHQAQALANSLVDFQVDFSPTSFFALTTALRPTAKALPRTLLKAATEGAIAADRACFGPFGVYISGIAADIADGAGEFIEDEPDNAKYLARTALRIDATCIEAHEVLGLLEEDVLRKVAHHQSSSKRARALLHDAHRDWCKKNPEEDPQSFWEFAGARVYIRANSNYGLALIRAAEEGFMEPAIALRDAEKAFSQLIETVPSRLRWAAIDRRMLCRVLLGDAQGAREDALSKAHVLSDHENGLYCTTAWTLAWAAMEDGGNGDAEVRAAIDACPHALPLLLDGIEGEQIPSRHDWNGRKAALHYVADMRDAWLTSDGLLEALQSYRGLAEARVQQLEEAAESCTAPVR